MPVAIGVGLEEDSTRCVLRCISSDGKGGGEVRKMKVWF